MNSVAARREAEAVLRESNIPWTRLEALRGGYINHVFRTDSGYVVRLADDPSSLDRLREEAHLLRRLRGVVPTWEMLKVGSRGPFTFQIHDYIEGETLTIAWPRRSASEREEIVGQLAEQLRILHAISFDSFGAMQRPDQRASSWQSCILGEIEDTLAILRNQDGDLVTRCDAVLYWAQQTSSILEMELEACLTHNDLWLNNILVEGSRVVGLIDFEFAYRGIPDLELYKLELFLRRPGDFGCEGVFDDFMPRLRRVYPELFEVDELPQRLDLYDLWCRCRIFQFQVQQANNQLERSNLEGLFEQFSHIMSGQIQRSL